MLSQSFGDIGEESAHDADTVTAVEFDEDGSHLATGDRGGRVVLFKSTGTTKMVRHNSNSVSSRKGLPPSLKDTNYFEVPLWSPFFQFQSHEVDFDYLKSIEIEERINQIKFCKPVRDKIMLLTTNDKTIKLWKVGNQKRYTCDAEIEFSLGHIRTAADIPLPRKLNHHTNPVNDIGIDDSTTAMPCRVYERGHSYHINSLSLNSDTETFLSADDLSVNLWKFENNESAYSVIDIKPQQMENLNEVITCAKFHPVKCNILTYTTSKGIINICDLRCVSRIDRIESMNHQLKLMQADNSSKSSSSISSSLSNGKAPSIDGISEGINPSSLGDRKLFTAFRSNASNTSLNTAFNNLSTHKAVKSYQSEVHDKSNISLNFIDVLTSISTFNFTHDGRYIVTRDYLSLKVWDTHMDSKPTTVIPVHDHIKPRLEYLYNSDAIFDKFEVFINGNASRIISGSYNNTFSIFSLEGQRVGEPVQLPRRSNLSPSSVTTVANFRPEQKILHGCCHPTANVVAVAGQTGLFMYSFR